MQPQIIPASQYNGIWYGDDKNTITSINPTTQKPLGEFALCDPGHCEKMIEQAKKNQCLWRNIPAPKRGELIRIIGEKFRSHKESLAQLITLEVGKITQEALGEVQEVIDMAEFAVGQSRMLYGKTMVSERADHRLYEQWHPYGVCGIITAFNFPMAVWAWNAFLALITGNTIIWKPSLKTPLCAITIQKMCQDAIQEAGFPNVISLLTASDALCEQLVNHKDVDIISFTGSCSVGQKVGTMVQSRFGQCILELGGNNAIIVDEDANLDLAIPAIVFGAAGTSGQRCTTTRRVFLPKTQFESISKKLIQAYQQIRVGLPDDPSTLMGPLIDEQAVTHFNQTIGRIKQQGGKILCGGKPHAMKLNFVQPTLIEASNDMPILQEENFAPICYLIPYTDLKQVICEHNNVPQGLSSAIFTNNLQNAEYFLSANGSDCGIANVNIGTSGAEIGGAFGGEKQTGGGREAGSDAWQSYMRRQTTTINWGNDLPLAQGIDFNVQTKQSTPSKPNRHRKDHKQQPPKTESK